MGKLKAVGASGNDYLPLRWKAVDSFFMAQLFKILRWQE